jgi:predicted deacylase
VRADRAGVVIGRTEAPLVNRGDALVHVAEVERPQLERPFT